MVKNMKNDFLTIPDAPNYEINSELIVRNKITGQILKHYLTAVNRTPIVELHNGKKSFYRSVKNLRRVAELEGLEWVKVPSLNYLYELSSKGHLRSAKNKYLLKLYRHPFPRGFVGYQVRINGTCKSVSLSGLLWECHGIFPTKKKIFTPIPVTIQKESEIKYFPTMTEGAKFLSKAEYYSESGIMQLFRCRKAEIGGWKIKYHEPDDMTEIKKAKLKIRKYNR